MVRLIPDLRIFFLLIFFSLLVLVFDSFNLLGLPKDFASYITNPISFGLYKTSNDFGKQFEFIFKARFASKENKALKEQLGKLLSENANLRKSLAEAESMVSQQNHLDPVNYNLVPARPIGLGRFLKIDQGQTSDIKVGQAVVYNDNFVGKVVQVSQKNANIQLLTDPESKVAAFSQNLQGRAKGVLIGNFGTEILMDKILHEEKIEVGDLVYSEGTEGFLPRGLILGRVIAVSGEENELFKQAKVQPTFDIRDLELVFVIVE